MKIAIEGAGIAGPALAFWLKHFGYQPTLFEQAPALRQGGYIVDFWGIGYTIAERMGLLPELKKVGYHIQQMKILSEKGKTLANLNTKIVQELTQDRFISVARSDLSRIIFEAVKGVEARFGIQITEVNESADGINLKLSDGSEEKFDLLIGADGLHSKVRSLVFGPESEFEYPLGAYVAAFTLENYSPRDELTYLMCPTKMKQVARVSLRNNQTLFLFIFRSDLILENPKNVEAQKNLLKEIFGDMGWEVPEILKHLDETKDFYFDTVSQIRMKHWTKGRVALVGDAAACVSLLAGEGTGLGILESYVLAEELHLAKGNYAKAFTSYETRLQAFLIAKQKAVLRNLSFFAPKNRFSLYLNLLAIKAMNIPILGKYLLGKMLADNFKGNAII